MDKDSLHYKGASLKKIDFNCYENAFYNVAIVLEPYIKDEMYSVYGFGGIPTYETKCTSHCFPLNMNHEDPRIEGINSVIGNYRARLADITLSGPTFLAPLLNKFLDDILKMPINSTAYYVLEIVTDGQIMDLDFTKTALVKLSHLPCSVVIIGVGNEECKGINELTSEDPRFKDENG